MVYIALIHYPVYDKNYKVVGTAISSLDLHDIARVCRTYGIKKFFIITPYLSQKALCNKIIEHWTKGYGSVYNPSRQEALGLIAVHENLEDTLKEIKEIEGREAFKVVTAARSFKNSISFEKLRDMLSKKEKPVIFLFGTGWGLEENLIKQSEFILEPLTGNSDYNHLSVRSAVAIVLARLFARKN